MTYQIKQITNEAVLKSVLDMCYSILGTHHEGLYSYKSWCGRLDRPYLMLYAEWEGVPIAAVLGRAENADGVVVGFAACREEFRRKGITSALMREFERSAAEHGYSRVTLTSYNDAWKFYQACGYMLLEDRLGRKTYQKMLPTY
ncbi:MAG: GNAT family N-acetyltransferase [Oscillospiraceae bacterium]